MTQQKKGVTLFVCVNCVISFITQFETQKKGILSALLTRQNMTENEVLASCIELLSLMNIYCWRNNTGALKDATGRLIRFGKVGSSDILGVLPDGKFLAVECKKSKGGIVSEYQEEFLQEINNCGGVGLVVRSSEELLNELKKRGYTNDRYRGKIYNK